jgi:hypothetical protein
MFALQVRVDHSSTSRKVIYEGINSWKDRANSSGREDLKEQ